MGTRRPLLAAVPEALGGAPRPAGSVEAARRLAGRLGAAFVPLGEPHGMARVVVREPGPAVVDLADFRGPTLDADLAGRDVTVNAPAVSLAALLGGAAPGGRPPRGLAALAAP